MQYYNNVFSKNEKLLGVEVAEKVIRCIYFEKKGDVYHILKTGKFESNHDLNLPGSLTQNISKFLEKELLFPDRIFLTISSKDTVIHQVILPKMSPVEMEEVISGEIEKIPTFYNTSYESIYSSYRFKAESKKVVIAAIPQKTLNFLLENIKKLNFNFKDVDIAPLNLKNILPVFFAQETSPKTKIEQSRAILIVHDECSFLTIVEGEIYKLIYKLPIGSETLSKIEMDDEKNHLISNWTSELSRVLKSYLSENKNEVIEELNLIFDMDKVKGLDVRLQADLGQSNVRILTLKDIKELSVEDESSFNPIYILAATPILYHIFRKKIDYPFTHFFKNFQIQEYLNKMLKNTAIALVFIMVCLSYFMYSLNTKKMEMENESRKITFKYETLKKESKRLFQIQEEYANTRNKLLSQATYVRNLNRISWAQVLAVVAKELPEELALNSFEFAESGSAKIIGEAYNMESIAGLIRRIDESVILEKAKFSFLREKQLEDQKIYSFGIFANLQNVKDKNVD